MDILQGEHSEMLSLIGVGYEKKWLSAYKSSNITETRQDRTNISIEDLYKVTYALSIGAKINDLARFKVTDTVNTAN